MAGAGDGERRFYNEFRLTNVLDAIEDDDVAADLAEALNFTLYHPDCDACSLMQATGDHRERWIAFLPHGYILVFSRFDGAPVPYKYPGLLVRHFYQFGDID